MTDQSFNIKVDMKEVAKRLRGASNQLPFVAAKALTDTAKEIKKAQEHEIVDVFDRPKPYTKRSIFFTPATKRNLKATVGIKDFSPKSIAPSKYLQVQTTGGRRRYKRYEIALQKAGVLPSGYFTVPGEAAKKDRYGNISAGQIVQILSYFRAFPEAGYRANSTAASRKRLAKGSKKKYGIAYFVGRPGARSHDYPLGVWMREIHGLGTRVRPVLIFTRVTPRYEKIYDFDFVSEITYKKHIGQNLIRAVGLALRTARR